MDLKKEFEKEFKNLSLLHSDLVSMLAKESPDEASRKSLEPSVILKKEGSLTPPDKDSMSKEEFIINYFEERIGDILK